MKTTPVMIQEQYGDSTEWYDIVIFVRVNGRMKPVLFENEQAAQRFLDMKNYPEPCRIVPYTGQEMRYNPDVLLQKAGHTQDTAPQPVFQHVVTKTGRIRQIKDA